MLKIFYMFVRNNTNEIDKYREIYNMLKQFVPDYIDERTYKGPSLAVYELYQYIELHIESTHVFKVGLTNLINNTIPWDLNETKYRLIMLNNGLKVLDKGLLECFHIITEVKVSENYKDFLVNLADNTIDHLKRMHTSESLKEEEPPW